VRRRALGPSPLRVTAVALAAAGVLGACSSTYDASATTPPTVPETATTFTVTGSTEEVLQAMATEVGALSERLIDNDGQAAALARIEAQWAAVKPTIQEEYPKLLYGFDSAMDQVRRAVERRRPADADKASRSLQTLIEAITG
jgi:hypothetical protein